MSDYFDFPPNDWDDEGEENPFQDLPGWDNSPQREDPYEEQADFLNTNFSLYGIDRIVIDISQANHENLRGNRFGSIEEAIMYLFDSGIYDFSNVVLDGDEILVQVDDCTQPPCD